MNIFENKNKIWGKWKFPLGVLGEALDDVDLVLFVIRSGDRRDWYLSANCWMLQLGRNRSFVCLTAIARNWVACKAVSVQTLITQLEFAGVPEDRGSHKSSDAGLICSRPEKALSKIIYRYGMLAGYTMFADKPGSGSLNSQQTAHLSGSTIVLRHSSSSQYWTSLKDSKRWLAREINPSWVTSATSACDR